MLSGIDFDVAPAPFNFQSGGSLLFSGRPQLCNQSRFFILVKSTCDLPHHHPRWIAAVGQVIAVRRQDADTAIDKGQNAQFLGDWL